MLNGSHQPESEDKPLDSLDILVVDDDAANLLAIEAALGDLGPRLVKASSGREALRRLLQQDFALILLDVHMPSMDGFETAGLIRARQRNRHVPIIFVTAYGQSDARVLEGYALGAVDFLFKPIVPEVLRAKALVFVELQQRTAKVEQQARQIQEHERLEALRRLEEERRQWQEESLRQQMDEQKRVTAEIQSKAEELARTVAERESAQRELMRVNAQLAETDRRKDEFLATLAHELRNPLAPLSYAVGLIEGTEDVVLQEARVRMERQLAHLSRLVDDLLDVSRVTSGKVELRREPLDLRDAITHAIEVSRSLLDERQHKLVLDLAPDPLIVKGDAVRLSQVVSNLLNNAARYTDPRGTITVRAARDGGEFVLAVMDDGQGIEQELLDHIFGAFVQAQVGGGGLGLGLHLVQHLVRLHGGTVRAESTGLGRGAKFEIRLPVVEGLELPPPAEPTTQTHRAQRALRPLHVVVVEDQEDVREMVVLLLTRWGHRVDAVEHGEDGVRLIVDGRPDLALVDIGLPDIDGYEVATRARERLGADCPPLIAVTGWGQDEDRRRAMEVGFARHLVKPVSPRDLRRALVLE
jgi:signal transduction histidine kinase